MISGQPDGSYRASEEAVMASDIGGRLEPLAKSAAHDLLDGLMSTHLWLRLGWLEVKRRYRRTIIGPFWTSISLAVFVITLGTVGAGLWNENIRSYLPYLTSGMLVWMMISATLTEACTLFIFAGNLLRNIRFDYSLLVYSLVWRNFIVLLHHLAVYAVLVLLLAPDLVGFNTLLVIPGLILLMINGAWITLLLGLTCLRFRDVQQVVTSLIQVSMFITPIFWPIDQLKGTRRMVFVEMNPLYHLVQIVRAPLLGQMPTALNYAVVILVAVVGWALTYFLFKKFRKRIAYWS
jgi:ABC-type polysaccharide/polyol phosphate export permease